MAVTLSGLRSAAPSAFEGNSGEKLPILLRKGTGEGRKQNYFINLPATAAKISLVLRSGARKSIYNAVCSLQL